MTYELSPEHIKQGLYTLDNYQTYDLFWFDKLLNQHQNLLSYVWFNHWIFKLNRNGLNIFLVERFTPWGYAWADQYVVRLFNFASRLSQYSVLNVPELSGERWDLENPTNLTFPDSLSHDIFPDQITLNIPANEGALITWLEFDQGSLNFYPIHPNINAEICIVAKRFKYFKPKKSAYSVTLSTQEWLVNSLVITGNCSLETDNGTILYADQFSRIEGIFNQLNLPSIQVLEQVNVTLTCEDKTSLGDEWGFSADWVLLEKKWDAPYFAAPLWQNIPLYYFWSGVEFANNSFDEGIVNIESLGYPLCPLWDGYNLDLIPWHIGDETNEDLSSIEIPLWDSELGEQFFLSWNRYSSLTTVRGLNISLMPYKIRDGFRISLVDFFPSSYHLNYFYFLSSYLESRFLAALQYQKNANSTSQRHTGNFHTISSYFSMSALDCRLVRSTSTFVWLPIAFFGEFCQNERTFTNLDVLTVWLTKENHKIIIKQIRGFNNKQWTTETETNFSVSGGFLCDPFVSQGYDWVSLFNFNDRWVQEIFPIEIGLWEFAPSPQYQLSNNQLETIIINLDGIEFDTEDYVMPDSPRIKEIHAALQADKYAYDDNDSDSLRVQNLGRMIEQIAILLGLNFNSNGTIRSIRQSKWIEQGGTLPVGWAIGQWGVNTGGSEEGQKGGNEGELRLGMAYEVRGNKFEIDSRTGEPTAIKEGGYVLVENFPQYLHILLNDLDKCLGLQELSAYVLPSADQTNYSSFEGLSSYLSEQLYMLSSMSINTAQSHIGVLKILAMLEEVLRALGLPIQLKAIDVEVGESEPFKAPYPGIQSDSPSLVDLQFLGLSNLSLLIAALQYIKIDEDEKDA